MRPKLVLGVLSLMITILLIGLAFKSRQAIKLSESNLKAAEMETEPAETNAKTTVRFEAVPKN